MGKITFRKKKHGVGKYSDGSGEQHIYYLHVDGKKTNYRTVAFNVACPEIEIECRVSFPRKDSKPRRLWYYSIEEAKKALVEIYNEHHPE